MSSACRPGGGLSVKVGPPSSGLSITLKPATLPPEGWHRIGGIECVGYRRIVLNRRLRI